MKVEDNMKTKGTLQDAIELAALAHRGQTRKNGTPYILHPLRVMLRMFTIDEMIVAVLHDVLEDCKTITPLMLKDMGFALHIIDALWLLNKTGKTYDCYVKDLSVNPLARKVKIADLRDNMNLTELPEITPKDIERNQKYMKALDFLLSIK